MFKFIIIFFVFFSKLMVHADAIDSPYLKSTENSISWNKWVDKIKNELDKSNLKPETKKHLDNEHLFAF